LNRRRRSAERPSSGTGIPEDSLALAGVEDAKLPAEHFDFISFGAVLEHLQSPCQAIERAIGWLKPGGIIQAEVPFVTLAHFTPGECVLPASRDQLCDQHQPDAPSIPPVRVRSAIVRKTRAPKRL
jgi:hypothetical protein